MNEVFLGRNFQSDDGVLKPRNYGEDMFILLRSLNQDFNVIADVGCGAGHLGITAALEFPKADIILIDNSREAIDNTKDNVELHKITKRCRIYEEYLENSKHLKVDVIITNLNFVPDGNKVDTTEPASAIYGGPTGMELYERFWNKVKKDGSIPRYVVTLCLRDQFARMDTFATFSGYKFSQRLRYASLYEKV